MPPTIPNRLKSVLPEHLTLIEDPTSADLEDHTE